MRDDYPTPALRETYLLPENPMRVSEGGRRTKRSPSVTESPPKITVVTVAYNAASTIEYSIKSVLAQNCGSIEYIVIDGGSSDGTTDILRTYEKDIEYWVSEPDLGIYDAMNKGISLARGDWIALLNADDEYKDCSSLSALMALPLDCRVAASDVLMGTAEGEKVFPTDLRRPRYRNIPYMHTGMFVRRSIYSQIGLYDTQYRIASDIDFIFRLIRSQTPILHLPIPLVRMRDGGASVQSFRLGRLEYRTIYIRNGGSQLVGTIGYWMTLAEKMLYGNSLARTTFRLIKGKLN